ncbi:MAG: hypothetical protein HRT57_11675 [Crocinitomicaceae bacterium]|nr:hypothetical protein [Crocinitomicaceae bacterium]
MYIQSIDELREIDRITGSVHIESADFKSIHAIYLHRAGAKARLDDYDGAITDYTAAFEKDSTYAEALSQRGLKKTKIIMSILKKH